MSAEQIDAYTAAREYVFLYPRFKLTTVGAIVGEKFALHYAGNSRNNKKRRHTRTNLPLLQLLNFSRRFATTIAGEYNQRGEGGHQYHFWTFQ